MKNQLGQLPLSLSHSTNFYSDDLVITKSNESAYELIEHWPNWPLPVAVLVGPNGSGKTHFSTVWRDIANASCFQPDQLMDAITMASKGKPILIEDIDTASWDEIALFHLINSIKQAHLIDGNTTLLLTSKTAPGNWRVSLDDLKSRLKSVTLATIEYPDDELLTSVAFKLFADRQITVESTAIDFLVSRCERSLFALEKIIDSVDRLALQRKSKVTKALISNVITSESEF